MCKFARELGVPLNEVKGAGLGLIPWPVVDFAKFGPIERKDRPRIKKISAANLHRNWVMIPHVTNHDDADITDLEAFRVATNLETAKSGKAYVLRGGEGTAQLAAFRQSLGLAMGNVGLPVKRSFTPHMTVFYDHQTIPEHAIEPIHWTVKQFALIKSHVGKEHHEALGCWSLRA